MTLKTKDQQTIRVTFKGYGFFVPKSGVEGQLAIVRGIGMKKEQSVDKLRHFAEDEGKSAEEIALIVEPLVSYAFVADGVIIEPKVKR